MANVTSYPQNVKLSVYALLSSLLPAGTVFNLDDAFDADPASGQWIAIEPGKNHVINQSGGQKRRKWIWVCNVFSRAHDDAMRQSLDSLADRVSIAGHDTFGVISDYSNPASPVASPYKFRLSLEGDDPIPRKDDQVYGRSITLGVNYIER